MAVQSTTQREKFSAWSTGASACPCLQKQRQQLITVQLTIQGNLLSVLVYNHECMPLPASTKAIADGCHLVIVHEEQLSSVRTQTRTLGYPQPGYAVCIAEVGWLAELFQVAR